MDTLANEEEKTFPDSSTAKKVLEHLKSHESLFNLYQKVKNDSKVLEYLKNRKFAENDGGYKY